MTAQWLLDVVADIGGFFYTIFYALGDISQMELFDILDFGLFKIYDNPLSTYYLTVDLNPQDSLLGQLFSKVLDVIAVPQDITVLQFMLYSVVVVFVLIVLVRWVALFSVSS